MTFLRKTKISQGSGISMEKQINEIPPFKKILPSRSPIISFSNSVRLEFPPFLPITVEEVDYELVLLCKTQPPRPIPAMQGRLKVMSMG